jgi:hypothetical protein
MRFSNLNFVVQFQGASRTARASPFFILKSTLKFQKWSFWEVVVKIIEILILSRRHSNETSKTIKLSRSQYAEQKSFNIVKRSMPSFEQIPVKFIPVLLVWIHFHYSAEHWLVLECFLISLIILQRNDVISRNPEENISAQWWSG